jgi:hypothetical protein
MQRELLEKAATLQQEFNEWAKQESMSTPHKTLLLIPLWSSRRDLSLRDSFPGWKAEKPIELTQETVLRLRKLILSFQSTQPRVVEQTLNLLELMYEAHNRPIERPQWLKTISGVKSLVNKLPVEKWMRGRRIILAHSQHMYQFWWLCPKKK